MEKPNYVLKANEGITVPKNDNPLLGKLKITVWIIIGVIILGSLLFQENLFIELSWTARVLLIVMAIGLTFSGGGYKKIPSSFEIQFYDDYLIVYREKRYINKKVSRREIDKFFYKDIKKCQFRTVTKQITIAGLEEAIRYKYNKDGSLPSKPTYHKTTEGLCYFYTTEVPEVDFVSEIERHSPIKVAIVD
ncbi:hypothetical protein [Niallia sp. Krafla_26]|uniref:hypothetical protein n=1 Tax=Niallia sp. Krafla_26 TaxID=3064703 RepID=UPI003D180514